MTKTPKQIEAEITALQNCKTYIPRRTLFGEDNHSVLDRQIEYLRGQIDISADEFYSELNEREQAAVIEAEQWADGDGEAPSLGWDSFKPKPKTPKRKK